jgi:hypothetical protein
LTVFIDAEGLPELARFMEISPKIATRAARLAINQTAERRGLKLAQEAMLAQVAFPKGYFNEIDRSGEKRFGLKYKATDRSLVAGIVGRQEGTQLSRFSKQRAAFTRGQRRRGSPPIRVTVNPGQTRTLPNAFFINLNSGNIGLGIRLKNGETLTNTTGAKLITKGPLAGVALLYGPSVDQVFRTVAVDISPPLLEALSNEFLRQFDRLFRDAHLTSA